MSGVCAEDVEVGSTWWAKDRHDGATLVRVRVVERSVDRRGRARFRLAVVGTSRATWTKVSVGALVRRCTPMERACGSSEEILVKPGPRRHACADVAEFLGPGGGSVGANEPTSDEEE